MYGKHKIHQQGCKIICKLYILKTSVMFNYKTRSADAVENDLIISVNKETKKNMFKLVNLINLNRKRSLNDKIKILLTL